MSLYMGMWKVILLLLLLLSKVNAVSSSAEAIVVLSDVMTWECEVPRLEALVRTAGPERDVWYLYGPSTADIAAELDQRIRGLHVAPRPSVEYLGGNVGTFGDQRTQQVVSAFLLWLSRSLYAHAWYVEMDTFYTGPWSNVFDSFAYLGDVDVVSHLVPDVGPSWYWWSSCELGGIACSQIQPIMTTWFIIRVSSRLSEKILDTLMTSSGKGHHEALTLSVCSKNGWKYTDFTDGLVRHRMNAGGYLHWTVSDHRNMTLSFHDIKPFTLYHPIKCSADKTLGKKAMMWTRQGIPVVEKIQRSQMDILPDKGHSAHHSTNNCLDACVRKCDL